MTTAEEAYKLFWGRRSLQEPRPHHESPRYPKPKHKEEFWDEVQREINRKPTNPEHQTRPGLEKAATLTGGALPKCRHNATGHPNLGERREF